MNIILHQVLFKFVNSILEWVYFYRPQMKFGTRLYFYTCLSFCSQGGVPAPGVCSHRGVPGPGGVVPTHGGSAPRGCLVETPLRRLLLQTVRVLLECILVFIVSTDSRCDNNNAMGKILLEYFLPHPDVYINFSATYNQIICNQCTPTLFPDTAYSSCFSLGSECACLM